MSRFALIWGWFTRVVLFFAGLAIIGYEVLGQTEDRPWLYAMAGAMMGLPFVGAAEGLLTRFANANQPNVESERLQQAPQQPPAQQPTVIVIREDQLRPRDPED